MKFYPFGDLRNSQGNLGTEKLFTGQILDDTGLYYYGARFYDPAIGRFISPDTIVQDAANPQSLNRYSYVMNNPLKYVDATGLWWTVSDDCQDIWIDDDTGAITPGYEQTIKQAAIDKAQQKSPQIQEIQFPIVNTFEETDYFQVYGMQGIVPIPQGYGTSTIYGTVTYDNEGAMISITVVTIPIDLSPTVALTYTTEVETPSDNYKGLLKPPTGPSLQPVNSSVFKATMRIEGLSPFSQATLTITPGAFDRYANYDEPRHKLVSPIWVINLQNGKISKRIF